MLNTLSFTWVKNVNNLRITPGKTSVQLSPISSYDYVAIKNNHGKVAYYPLSILTFTQRLSTWKSAISDLLYNVYTHNPQHLLIEPLKKI